MSQPKKRNAPCKRYMQVFTRVVIEGRTQEEVAQELGLKYESVVNICYKVKAYLREHGASLYLPNQRRMRAIHARELYLARLEHQWEQLMQEWYRSKQPAESEKAGNVEGDGKNQKRAERQRKTQTGNVKYLIEARANLREIREICMSRPYATKEQNHVKLLTLKQREAICDRLLAENGVGVPASDDAGDDRWGTDSARAA